MCTAARQNLIRRGENKTLPRRWRREFEID